MRSPCATSQHQVSLQTEVLNQTGVAGGPHAATLQQTPWKEGSSIKVSIGGDGDDDDGVVEMRSPSATSRHHPSLQTKHLVIWRW
jgi:hypothetical protein